MTLNDLEPSKRGFLVHFSQFLDAVNILTVNCDEMARGRLRQLVYEIFSIIADFNSPIPDPLGSRRPAQAGVKDGFPLQKMVILPQLSSIA